MPRLPFRLTALLLSLALALPNSAFALRVQEPETPRHRAGLEAAMRSPDPAAGAEERGLSGTLFRWAAVTLLGLVSLGIPSSDRLPDIREGAAPAPVVWFSADELFQRELSRINQLNREEIEQGKVHSWTKQEFEAELARINAMTDINGVPIAEIERRARPGKDSDEGFLGRKDSMREVLADDLKTEYRIGTSRKELAKHLKRITLLAQGYRREFFEMEYRGQPLWVSYAGTRGPQTSILDNSARDENNPDNRGWRHELQIENRKNGLHVLVGGNVEADGGEGVAYGLTGYIERHGFYEGGGRENPWRVDPAVLHAILTGQPATDELKRRESITFYEVYERNATEQLRRAIEEEQKQPLNPLAAGSFREALKKLPAPVLRELLDLAKRRHPDYRRKLLGEDYQREYGFPSLRHSYTSGDPIPQFDLLYIDPKTNKYVYLNLSQQARILEQAVSSLRAGVEEVRVGVRGRNGVVLPARVFKTPESIGRYQAKEVMGLWAKAVMEWEPFVIGLPTGSTPMPFLKEIVEALNGMEVETRNNYLRWLYIVAMDDIVDPNTGTNVKPEHPKSARGFFLQNFFERIKDAPAPDESHLIIPTMGKLTEQIGEVKKLGGVSWQMMATDPNEGHVAEVAAGERFRDPAVRASKNEAREFSPLFLKHNGWAAGYKGITLTLDDFVDLMAPAGRVSFAAFGGSKSGIVQRLIAAGEYDPQLPISFLWLSEMAPRTELLLDQEIARFIPAGLLPAPAAGAEQEEAKKAGAMAALAALMSLEVRKPEASATTFDILAARRVSRDPLLSELLSGAGLSIEDYLNVVFILGTSGQVPLDEIHKAQIRLAPDLFQEINRRLLAKEWLKADEIWAKIRPSVIIGPNAPIEPQLVLADQTGREFVERAIRAIGLEPVDLSNDLAAGMEGIRAEDARILIIGVFPDSMESQRAFVERELQAARFLGRMDMKSQVRVLDVSAGFDIIGDSNASKNTMARLEDLLREYKPDFVLTPYNLTWQGGEAAAVARTAREKNTSAITVVTSLPIGDDVAEKMVQLQTGLGYFVVATAPQDIQRAVQDHLIARLAAGAEEITRERIAEAVEQFRVEQDPAKVQDPELFYYLEREGTAFAPVLALLEAGKHLGSFSFAGVVETRRDYNRLAAVLEANPAAQGLLPTRILVIEEQPGVDRQKRYDIALRKLSAITSGRTIRRVATLEERDLLGQLNRILAGFGYRLPDDATVREATSVLLRAA